MLERGVIIRTDWLYEYCLNMYKYLHWLLKAFCSCHMRNTDAAFWRNEMHISFGIFAIRFRQVFKVAHMQL